MSAIHLLNEDLLLWNRFRSGDANAFAALMHLHYNDLFNYATRFTKDTEMVKDCIQDLYLSLWKNRLTINETSFVRYYLLKSLRRNLGKAIQKRKNTFISYEFGFESLFDEDLSAESKLIRAESLSELALQMRSLLSKLSRRQQEVIYLRFYMDADTEEIAEIMGVSRQSVYNLLHDGLKTLKKITPQKKHFPFFFLSLIGVMFFILLEF